MRHYTALLLLALAGCATTGDSPVDAAAAARLAQYDRTGEKDTCLGLPRISQITAVDERTLLVRSGVSTWYVSDLPGRCSGVVSRGNRIEYTTSIGELCRGDILRIVDNGGGFLAGSCSMGSFERLTEKPAAE